MWKWCYSAISFSSLNLYFIIHISMGVKEDLSRLRVAQTSRCALPKRKTRLEAESVFHRNELPTMHCWKWPKLHVDFPEFILSELDLYSRTCEQHCVCRHFHLILIYNINNQPYMPSIRTLWLFAKIHTSMKQAIEYRITMYNAYNLLTLTRWLWYSKGT